MESMTGYGSSVGDVGPYNIDLKIKSLNSRYLDIKIHCPYEFSEFEIELKKKLQKKLSRGKVDVYINKKITQLDSSVFAVSASAAKFWNQTYSKVKKSSGLSGEPSAEWLLRQEGVVVSKAGKIQPKNKKELILLFDKAVVQLVSTRAKEGLSLKKFMVGQLKDLDKGLSHVKQKQKKRTNPKATQDKINKKWKAINKDIALDENRLAQEVIAYIDRMDISEEISRLDEHIRQMLKICSSKEAKGKKLDFYCQELFREVNTIGSKANDSSLTVWVVEAKNIIEKLREQAQNIQ